MSFYKKLYSRIGGRPWTYILRDLWTDIEWLWQLIWFGLGVMICYFLDWRLAMVCFGIYTIGFIGGHLWWGTKHIKGQKGD